MDPPQMVVVEQVLQGDSLGPNETHNETAGEPSEATSSKYVASFTQQELAAQYRTGETSNNEL